MGKSMRILAWLLLICFFPAVRPAVAEKPSAAFSQQFSRDVGTLRTLTGNLAWTMAEIKNDASLFDPSRTKDFDVREKEKLYSLWSSLLDHLMAFEGMTAHYKDFYLLKEKTERADAFLLAYASYLGKFSSSLRFIRRTIDNELYEKKLDDPDPDYGIPRGMYGRLKWNTIHLQDLTAVLAGHHYYRFLEKTYRAQGLRSDPRTAWIFDDIDLNYEFIIGEMKAKGAGYFAANGLDILREKSFAVWFPLQTGVSEWMGDTKVKRLHREFITAGQIYDMGKVLQPGDIIVERRNWYLSNIGLPGFWPHAELFIGSGDELREYFSDGDVTAHYRSKGNYRDFADYLGKRHPAAFAAYMAKAADGMPHRIIEAVSEGVKFSSLEEGTSADYIGVVRPRLSKLDIAKAIDEAFRYVGRPYDFNFDFLTDDAIVCSELIYKVYLDGPQKKGLRLKLREIAGRKAIPANDIVGKFDAEFAKPDRELDFVYFLEGNEEDQKASAKGPAEFRATFRRPKWDIVQQ